MDEEMSGGPHLVSNLLLRLHFDGSVHTGMNG